MVSAFRAFLYLKYTLNGLEYTKPRTFKRTLLWVIFSPEEPAQSLQFIRKVPDLV